MKTEEDDFCQLNGSHVWIITSGLRVPTLAECMSGSKAVDHITKVACTIESVGPGGPVIYPFKEKLKTKAKEIQDLKVLGGEM